MNGKEYGIKRSWPVLSYYLFDSVEGFWDKETSMKMVGEI
jgi:hypothetical protein